VYISQNIRGVEYTGYACHSITCFRIINSNPLWMGGVYTSKTRRQFERNLNCRQYLGSRGSDVLDGLDEND
jgi:hypothetical protein